MQNLTFGQAIEALKEGKKVARAGWNGKGMFLKMTSGITVLTDNISHAVLKAEAEKRGMESLQILPHIDMWTATNELCIGWLASQTDMLSNDWQIVE